MKLKDNRNYYFLFVGYGSIAKQHINNLLLLSKFQNFSLKIDLVRRSKTNDIDNPRSDVIKSVYTYQDELHQHYDGIFITNPTSEHYSTLIKYFKYSDYFFVEKPIFENSNYDINFLQNSNKHIYVACPLRFKKVFLYLKANLCIEEVLSFRAISSSYLPNWRPNEDYRKSYSANAKLGGGVDLDLVHEWDYIHNLFGGDVKEIIFFKDKISKLEINSYDLALYLIKYSSFYGEIHLDYFGKFPQRKLQIITKNDFINVDFISNTINYAVKNKNYVFSEPNNQMKFEEIKYFLFLLNDSKSNKNNLNFAIKTLDFVLGKTK